MKLPTNYNILDSVERTLVREAYITQQKGKCVHCKENLDTPTSLISKYTINPTLFPPHFFKYPIHLHHNHATGMTIGAAHCHCNAILWQYHNQ
jgi:hypothetical protein